MGGYWLCGDGHGAGKFTPRVSSPGAGIVERENKNMNVIQDYRKVMVCSAGWLGPLSSPMVALTASKIAGALWTILLR